MGDPAQWIDEEALARALNIERELLRAMRPTLPPEDVQMKNGAVQWSEKMAALVARELGLLVLAAVEAPPPPPLADPETLTVHSQAANRNIVNALRANGERVAVRVVDNRKYLPRTGNGQPMTLRARRSPVGSWWTLVGREPRWPGIW